MYVGTEGLNTQTETILETIFGTFYNQTHMMCILDFDFIWKSFLSFKMPVEEMRVFGVALKENGWEFVRRWNFLQSFTQLSSQRSLERW